MIIGFTGQKGSGKDTAALTYIGEGYSLVRFADPLKNMLRRLYFDAGLESVEVERRIEGDLKELPCHILSGKSPRHAMQTLGTEWRDLIGRELWSNIAKFSLIEEAHVVVPDVRFKHEANLIRSLGGTVLRVDRPNLPSDGHISETEMLEIETSFTFVNDTSIARLHHAVINYIEASE
jgi:hypothetical protein